MIDLGSGPGTMLLGLCDFLRSLPESERPRSLELVAVDDHAENLRDAERFLAELGHADPRVPPLRFEALRLDVVGDRRDLFPLAVARGRFDIVILGNVLCEIQREPNGAEKAGALGMAIANELLAPDGAIVAIEPALRETARNLERWRDRLLADAGLFAIAPCVDQRACPALATDRDWCVTSVPWHAPSWIADVDRRTGLRKGDLKLAYLVLAKQPPAAAAAGIWQVVSDVLDSKGQLRVYLCGDGHWIVLRHLKRRGGELEADLRSLRRGDLVAIDALEPEGNLHAVPKGGRIRKL